MRLPLVKTLKEKSTKDKDNSNANTGDEHQNGETENKKEENEEKINDNNNNNNTDVDSVEKKEEDKSENENNKESNDIKDDKNLDKLSKEEKEQKKEKEENISDNFVSSINDSEEEKEQEKEEEEVEEDIIDKDKNKQIIYDELLTHLFNFLDNESSLKNNVLSGYFTKIINYLLKKNTILILEYFVKNDKYLLNKLLNKIGQASICNIVENILNSLTENLIDDSDLYFHHILEYIINLTIIKLP